MCGIVAVLQSHEHEVDDRLKFETLTSLITNRGPDGFGMIPFVNDLGLFSRPIVLLGASVLHIQGDTIARQPFVDECGNILLWNGEVFGGVPQDDITSSDTALVSHLLRECIASTSLSKSPIDDHQNINDIGSAVASCLCAIHGPFAFVYLHRASATLHAGRDPFGRRSLLVEKSGNTITGFCSVLPPGDISEGTTWEEAPVSGIFSISLRSKVPSDFFTSASGAKDKDAVEVEGVDGVGGMANEGKRWVAVAWPRGRLRLGRTAQNDANFAPRHPSAVGLHESSQLFLLALRGAVTRRVTRLCSSGRVGAVESGGIDSVLLAAVLHLAAPPGPIDLLNVTFEEDVTEGSGSRAIATPSPDRLAAIAAVAELQELFPSREWRLVNIDVGHAERQQHEAQIKALIAPSDTHMDLNIGTAFWFASRGRGYLRRYSAADVLAAYGASEGGRPLLRLGGAGAALSVGLQRWGTDTGSGIRRSQRQRGSSPPPPPPSLSPSPSPCLRAHTSALADPNVPALSGQGAGSKGGGNDDDVEQVREKEGGQDEGQTSATWAAGAEAGATGRPPMPRVHIRCGKHGCSRISKPGCTFGFCKRCCINRTKGRSDDPRERSRTRAAAPPQIATGVGTGVGTSAETDVGAGCGVGTRKGGDDGLSLPLLDETDSVDRKGPETVRGHEKMSNDAGQGQGHEEEQLQEAKPLSFLPSLPSSPCPVHRFARTGGGAQEEEDKHTHKVVAVNNQEDGEEEAVDGTSGVLHEEARELAGKGLDQRGGALCDPGPGAGTDPLDPLDPSEARSKGVQGVQGDQEGRWEAGWVPFTSTCKALLVGIGADEQMGGYSRHRTAFLRGGLTALEAELAMDTERLWKRNLGRDDRCVSAHGREAWFPFLDEELVALLQTLRLEDICDLKQPPGEGDKRILRLAAKGLGLRNCSEFVKRAIQFGTRVAKHTNKQYHGSHRKGKGDAKI